MEHPRTFTPITEHPLPLTPDEKETFVEEMQHADRHDLDEMGIDELHETYKHVLAETNSWRAFEIRLPGYGQRVYIWNHQIGEGMAVETDEWMCGNLAEIFALLRQSSQTDSDDLPVTGDGGCPYCGGELNSYQQGPTGIYKQVCDDCGQSRLTG